MEGNTPKWVEKIVIGFGVAALTFGLSVLSGTFLWLIYPHIHALFPNAAKNGIIAKSLSWWDSVCIVWIFSILIRPSSSNNLSAKK